MISWDSVYAWNLDYEVNYLARGFSIMNCCLLDIHNTEKTQHAHAHTQKARKYIRKRDNFAEN